MKKILGAYALLCLALVLSTIIVINGVRTQNRIFALSQVYFQTKKNQNKNNFVLSLKNLKKQIKQNQPIALTFNSSKAILPIAPMKEEAEQIEGCERYLDWAYMYATELNDKDAAMTYVYIWAMECMNVYE